MYGQIAEPLNRAIGIEEVEFQAVRERVIPGSIRTGEVRCLSVSPSSHRIVFSGWSWSQGTGGVFEIDRDAGTIRELPASLPSFCGGPDGKPALEHAGKQLGLVDQGTGSVQTIKSIGADASCEWAPDGRWIVCVNNRRLVLVDSSDPSRPRDLGTSGSGPVAWSPDSKRLLLVKSQASCLPTLHGQSLEVLDVQTGKGAPVKSSHCSILSGSIGWLDRAVAK